MTEAPQKAILALGVEGYFNWLAKLMGTAAKPPAEDAPMLECMAKIGICPGSLSNSGSSTPRYKRR
jgi:hypothetical protein